MCLAGRKQQPVPPQSPARCPSQVPSPANCRVGVWESPPLEEVGISPHFFPPTHPGPLYPPPAHYSGLSRRQQLRACLSFGFFHFASVGEAAVPDQILISSSTCNGLTPYPRARERLRLQSLDPHRRQPATLPPSGLRHRVRDIGSTITHAIQTAIAAMATDFIMPTQQDQSSVYSPAHAKLPHQSLFTSVPVPTSYAPSAPYNTPSSTQVSPLSTSGNASPTSPRNYLGRATRPMYMPAVLRPTEFPSKAPPPRPRAEDEDDAEERTLRPNSSFIGGLNALGRLSRRSTGDSGKCVDGTWNLDLFPQPTGTPTRKHWKVCSLTTLPRMSQSQPYSTFVSPSVRPATVWGN